jgi:hypothetical protein
MLSWLWRSCGSAGEAVAAALGEPHLDASAESAGDVGDGLQPGAAFGRLEAGDGVARDAGATGEVCLGESGLFARADQLVD